MPERSGLDWVSEAVAFAVLVGTFVVLAAHWNEIPAQVPRHFRVSGLPNRWGDKSGLWLLPVISFVLYLALTAVSRYVSRYPQMINVPMGIDRGDPGVQKLLLSMTVALKMAIVIGFACISWATVKTALGRSNGLPPWLLPVFLILVAAPLVWYLVRLRRYRSL